MNSRPANAILLLVVVLFFSSEAISKWATLPAIFMPAIVSLAALGTGLYIIASNKSGEQAKHIASGIIGIVLGYWLHLPK